MLVVSAKVPITTVLFALAESIICALSSTEGYEKYRI
jgi:hypothetical protein